MYKIHLDYKEVELNIVTPNAVKKYREFIEQQTNKDVQGATEKINKELPNLLENNEIKSSALAKIIAEAGTKQILDSLEIYFDEDFIFGWLPVLFKLENVDYKKDWLEKFSIDEFIRGMYDFFFRLKIPLKK